MVRLRMCSRNYEVWIAGKQEKCLVLVMFLAIADFADCFLIEPRNPPRIVRNKTELLTLN